jgi:hemolysin D
MPMFAGAADEDFLPAAMALERTPIPLLVGSLVPALCALLIAVVAWTWLSRVDVVVSARGRVVPSGQVKHVQAQEPGIVTAIHVSEGQRVAAGDRLLELDPRAAEADHLRLAAERRHLEHERARLTTLLALLAGPKPLAASADPRVVSEFSSFAAARRALEEEIALAAAEEQMLAARLAQSEATLPLLQERSAALASLAARQLAPRLSWLELEEQRLHHSLGQDVLRAERGMSRARNANASERLAQLAAQTRAGWLAELEQVRTRLAVHAEAEQQNLLQRARLHVHAPVAGTVQDLALSTHGAVVGAGERLLNIVPEAVPLMVEAWLENQDVGHVRAGQTVVIKVETFPFTRYGTLAGTIAGVAPDATALEREGLLYLARIHLEDDTLWVDGSRQRLTPGMAISAEVHLGTRRLLEYLLAPLMRHAGEAFRER